jgi:hypothetical protein
MLCNSYFPSKLEAAPFSNWGIYMVAITGSFLSFEVVVPTNAFWALAAVSINNAVHKHKIFFMLLDLKIEKIKLGILKKSRKGGRTS